MTVITAQLLQGAGSTVSADWALIIPAGHFNDGKGYNYLLSYTFGSIHFDSSISQHMLFSSETCAGDFL